MKPNETESNQSNPNVLPRGSDEPLKKSRGRPKGSTNASRKLREQLSGLETTILWDPALGNVQFGHDLDTRNDRGMMLLGNGRHRLTERAVDPVLDANLDVTCLDV